MRGLPSFYKREIRSEDRASAVSFSDDQLMQIRNNISGSIDTRHRRLNLV